MGVGLIFLSCVLFVHLGLGETICRIIRLDLYILKCPRCICFWSVLVYTLFATYLCWEACLAIAFVSSYLALWVDLALTKIAKVYEKLYDKQD